MKTKRCAVYTRKSSEEGLEQAFNSLDAQREACEAYIKSQAHEGWRLVKTAYDDGGFSGGTMERPALQRLLADLRHGLLDVILVYKIDRLTRSLADFARIVETLDRQGASFVSITQQFNTTTSMGRLTLNVLLSFAQFEREVTGERIRDKIAASKRKGMWMGGNLPLGYDLMDRQLVINDREAETVRYIYQQYLELGTVSALQAELRRQNIVSKAWVSGSGRKKGGVGYSRGALYYLLRNPLYVGRITHRGAMYDGQHPAIVLQEAWDQVQAMLTRNRQGKLRTARAAVPCLLAGYLYDDRGHLMSPSHSRKATGQRYQYYVSQALLQGQADDAGSVRRVSADAIETIIDQRLREALPQPQQKAWLTSSTHQKRTRLKQLMDRVVISRDCVEIKVTDAGRETLSEVDSGSLRIETMLKAAVGGKQIVSRNAAMARVDRSLVKAIAWARDLRQRLERECTSLDELARQEGCSRPYVSSMIKLAYLAPSITQAILDGTQPTSMTLADLMKRDIPVSWTDQRRAFGFL
ncbi:MAG: recombinase family protein [Alphaproteobacteria bacterium]|nr:recombinase family protein [Alphaproteobacteria bacterium]